MSILRYIPRSRLRQLTEADRRHLRRMLNDRSALNELLNKPVNRHLLNELRCVLDKQPLHRQASGQCVRGQVSRLTDGVRHPCRVRKMTADEMVMYGVREVTA